MSTQQQHGVFEEWLELELDGSLAPEQEARLAAHAADCARCRAARRSHAQLAALLAAARVEVEPGFRERVLQALPAAGWEARHPRTWRLPLTAFVVLGGLAAALLGVSSAHVEPGGSVLGAVLALGGLARAAVLAGAGLLGASWKGIGLAVRELLDSPANLGALGLLVLCLDLLLVSLLRRRRPARDIAARAAGAPDAGRRRGRGD
jgi:predicted anti-sigma-YlaC factor YlaD